MLMPSGDPSAEDLPGDELGVAAERRAREREREQELAARQSADLAPAKSY